MNLPLFGTVGEAVAAGLETGPGNGFPGRRGFSPASVVLPARPSGFVIRRRVSGVESTPQYKHAGLRTTCRARRSPRREVAAGHEPAPRNGLSRPTGLQTRLGSDSARPSGFVLRRRVSGVESTQRYKHAGLRTTLPGTPVAPPRAWPRVFRPAPRNGLSRPTGLQPRLGGDSRRAPSGFVLRRRVSGVESTPHVQPRRTSDDPAGHAGRSGVWRATARPCGTAAAPAAALRAGRSPTTPAAPS